MLLHCALNRKTVATKRREENDVFPLIAACALKEFPLKFSVELHTKWQQSFYQLRIKVECAFLAA